MNEILLNYIVQAILGGASGYITNDYAINMLFKEYTPLKLGGVIKKTRKEFIENLSSMVENDIINKEKLHEIFNSDDFMLEFEKLTGDFYENCLYETVGSDRFSDIDEFDSTISKADNFVNEILNEHIGGLINLISDNFDLSYFLTDVQTDKISDSFYNSIKDVLENTKIIENTLIHLYENNKKLKLSEVFDQNMNLAIVKSVNKFVDIAADKTVDSKIVELTGFNDAVSKALNVFYDKQIKDIININGEMIDSFISSIAKKEDNVIYKICRSLFSYGRNLNKSIYSLLDPAFENSLKMYIEQNLPYVTDKLVAYVQKNNMLIDRIIEDSIDEVINESEGLRAKLLSTIKNTYFNNLSKKYSIVEKIVSFIRESQQSEKISTNISKAIIERLNSITIADIIVEAENNNFNSEKAYKMVTDLINKNSAAIGKNIESFISERTVKDVFPMFNLTGEKILTSPVIINILKNKSVDFFESVLSDELNNLISENKLDVFVNKAASYLKIKFSENEKSIKNFLTEIFKKVQIDKNVLKSQTVTDFAKTESYNKYKEESMKLGAVNLSVAIDKLNSIENISKNSSETLQKFMINNTDTILKGSIKGVVTDNLNKLSDDELVNFANDFIGRELKPIMIFGGILGIIAGLILAAFQNSPVNPNEINLSNMVTYALVGFITNVVAINMIFKPYKKMKFLSKVPFLRNFSLGYIIKNQKNFAESTAHYIDNSLLSKKSINELFEKHKNNIKRSFAKNISENDYQTLSNLLIKNKESAISGTYGFLKGKFLKNLNGFSEFLYKKISSTNLKSVITDNNISSIIKFVYQYLKNTTILSSKTHSLISSDKELNTIISEDSLVDFLDNQAMGVYDKSIKFLEPDNLKKEIIKNNDKYIKNTNRSIQEVFNINDENLSLISRKVNELILSESFRNNISLTVSSLFNKLFERNKTFEELFDGKFKTYIDKNMPRILINMSDKIKDSLAESKKVISMTLRAELKNQLGFIERGIFSFMGGDELIDDILNRIMTDKLPKFMDAKKDEINIIITDLVNEKFYKAKVEVLYTKLNSLQINDMVENYLNTNTSRIKNRTNNLVLELYKKIKNYNTNNILKYINIDDLNNFINSYDVELNAFAETMNLSLKDKKNQITNEASSYIGTVAKEFTNLKLNDIFSDISLGDVDKIIKKSTNILNKNTDFEKILKSFIESYNLYHSNVHLSYYVDKDEFINSTEKFVNNLLLNIETEETIKQILHSIIDEAADSNFSFIDISSKEYVVNIFVDSSIEGLRRNLDDMLKSVEFDKIAAEEIETMEPEKIHQMFNSFGEKYFRKLMLYGFGGFVFGINMYIGAALTGLKILSETLKMKFFIDGE